MHFLCTICSDLINQAENIYVTKCGHIFHYHCLTTWTNRSKTCPQCRQKTPDSAMFRVYPTISNESTGDDVVTLQSKFDNAQLQLRQLQTKVKETEECIAKVKKDLKDKEDLIKTYDKRLASRDSAVAALKDQLLYLEVKCQQTKKLQEENETLNKNMQLLKGLQQVLNATCSEVEEMLQGYTDIKTVATFATALKKALLESESKNKQGRERLLITQRLFAQEKDKLGQLQIEFVTMEEKLTEMERKYNALKSKRKLPELEKCRIESAPKLSRPSNDFDSGIVDQSLSFNSMVARIENADSPYLNLKQSSVALSALQRGPAAPSGNMKPSEMKLLNSHLKPSKSLLLKSATLGSMLHKKIPLRPTTEVRAPLDVSYDGLGGHSKLDTFPVPNRQPLRSCIPKVTTKHKLKRPEGTLDISKMLQRKAS